MASSSSFVLEPALSSHFNSSPPSSCLPCCIYAWQSCSPSVFILPDKSSQAFFQSPPHPPTCFPPACVPVCAPLAQPPSPKHTGEGLMLVLVSQQLLWFTSRTWAVAKCLSGRGGMLKPGPAPIPCRQIHVTNCPQCSAELFRSC